MDEAPYQNREIDVKFFDIKESLDRIEAQTTKTNGSVAEANKEISKIKMWHARLLGFISAMTVVFAILAFVMGQIVIPIVSAYIGGKN